MASKLYYISFASDPLFHYELRSSFLVYFSHLLFLMYSSIFSIIRSTWFNYIQGRENGLQFTRTPKIIKKVSKETNK